MPKHHQSTKHQDRPHKNQQQKQKRVRQPARVAPQQVPRDPSSESFDEAAGSGPSVVPYGRNFDALLQESEFRQLGQQQRPLQHQLSSQSSESASSSAKSLHQRHPLWPDPNLLSAAMALATASDGDGASEAAAAAATSPQANEDRDEDLIKVYLQLLGAESLPTCLPEEDPVDEVSAASGDESDQSDEESDSSYDNEDEFGWLDVDCIAVNPQQPAKSDTSVKSCSQSADDIAEPQPTPPPVSVVTEPPPLPPPPPLPAPLLPDSRPAIRQTRDLSELDEDLDRLLQDED